MAGVMYMLYVVVAQKPKVVSFPTEAQSYVKETCKNKSNSAAN